MNAKKDFNYSPRKTRSIQKEEIKSKVIGQAPKCQTCHGLKKSNEEIHHCPLCSTPFHFSCLQYQPETIATFQKHPEQWQCPRCVVCTRCEEFIHDSNNVQCFVCGRAWHGECRPRPAAQPASAMRWVCDRQSCKRVQLQQQTQNAAVENGHGHSSAEKTPHFPTRLAAGGSDKQNLKTHAKDRGDASHSAVANVEKAVKKERSPPKKEKSPPPSPRKISLRSGTTIFSTQNGDPLPTRGRKKSESALEATTSKNKLTAQRSKSVQQHPPAVKNQPKNEDDKKGPPQPKRSLKRLGDVGQALNKSLLQQKNARQSRSVVFGGTSTDGGSTRTGDLFAEQAKYLSEFSARATAKNGESAEPKENQHVDWVYFGPFMRLRPVYESSYPDEINTAKNIYVCEFCLMPMVNLNSFKYHVMSCTWKYPPGNEIYREEGNFNIWEVEGSLETEYCRNLCLLAKLFLSSKTLYLEVETFTFYVLCEITKRGCVLAGYFSKEKNPSKNNNLSCLLTLPSSQGKGYGKLLIDLSYALSKREHKIGSPEHPLSDLGLITYRSYWKQVLFSAMRKHHDQQTISIKDLSVETAIHNCDIMSTLLGMNMIIFDKQDNCFVDISKALNASLASIRRRSINPELLIWEPPFEVKKWDRMNSYAVSTD